MGLGIVWTLGLSVGAGLLLFYFLGLDSLRRFRCCVDVSRNVLRVAWPMEAGCPGGTVHNSTDTFFEVPFVER